LNHQWEHYDQIWIRAQIVICMCTSIMATIFVST
jgi:hypothetical protein